MRKQYSFFVGGVVAFYSVQAWPASFDCLIEPKQTVEVGSPITGRLEKVHVRRGQTVRKGQVIASLESRVEEDAVELARFKAGATGPIKSAESNIAFAKLKFERRKEMAAKKFVSPQERDDAEADYMRAQAELQIARENKEMARLEYRQQSSLLDLRKILSPINGVVAEQMLYPGEIVEPSGDNKKSILKLAQLDPLRVHVILPMAAFGKIKSGMKVSVFPEAPVGGKHDAKVTIIDKLIDGPSGTFAVYLDMKNPKLRIPAGVKCKAEFPVE